MNKKRKNCIICGKIILSGNLNKNTCSEECFIQHRRDYHREYEKNYKKSHPEYRKYIENYSIKNKERKKERRKKYQKENRTRIQEKHREYKRKWRQTKKGRENVKRSRLRRRLKAKNKKFIEIMPNIFPENISVDYHHIDGKWFVVPLPKNIHQMHIGKIDYHLKETNQWVEIFYNFNINEFLNNEELVKKK